MSGFVGLKLKVGVSINGIKPELSTGLQVALGYFKDNGIDEMVVTSVLDSQHRVGSLHYVGYAADLRIWAIPEEELTKFTLGLAEALGSEFDVLLEDTHIPVEFQPKK